MRCSECGEEIIDDECLCNNPDDAPVFIDDEDGDLMLSEDGEVLGPDYGLDDEWRDDNP